MSNPLYTMYKDQVFDLVDTLVIKSDIAAFKTNEGVLYKGYEVYEDPLTWKYYKNINGEYHESDTPMTIVSTDTLETIEFNKANLEIHKATKRAYAYGGEYYNNLVARYHEQETLILGILNPVDISTAIYAYDGEILYYNKDLVEPQERTLIKRLQDYINAFNVRWHVKGYVLTDEYYPVTMFSILIANLAVEILNIRTELCKTDEAHSFHMTRYLAAHTGLDVYVPWFTLEQKLFFYRNIKYIQNNAGKSDTFDLLLKKVLTDRNIPLDKYTLEHDVRFLLDELEPRVWLKKTPLNDISSDGSTNIRSVRDIVNKQVGIAKSNDEVSDLSIIETESNFKRSNYNTLDIKTLESSMLDVSENVPISLSDILVNHWLYLAATDRYTSQINVVNPLTGVSFSISVKDAIPLYFYVLSKSMMLDITHVPFVTATRIRKPKLPTKDELMSYISNRNKLQPYVDVMLDNHEPIGEYISVDAYLEYCTKLYETQAKHRMLISHGERHTDRAMLEQLNHALYMDIRCDIDAGMLYKDWLLEKNIELDSLSLLELQTMSIDILQEATGAKLGAVRIGVGDIQEAMLSVMSRLSSYSVHYVRKTLVLSSRLIDFPGLRLNDISGTSELSRQYELSKALSDKGKLSSRLTVKSTKGGVFGPIRGATKIKPMMFKLDLKYNIALKSKHEERMSLHLGRISYKDPSSINC